MLSIATPLPRCPPDGTSVSANDRLVLYMSIPECQITQSPAGGKSDPSAPNARFRAYGQDVLEAITCRIM